MDVTLQEAYAEACKALGEALVRERLLTQELARLQEAAQPDNTSPSVVLEKDGVKVCGPHPDGSYTASWGGQWLTGSWADPDAAHLGALEQIANP